MRVFMALVNGFLHLLSILGFREKGLPPQPLFDLFKLYRGVYCGAIKMTNHTDWEMHPDGDETLTLLSGRIELILQQGESERSVFLTPNRSVVVQAGIWHRQVVHESGELLFMTFGGTTEHRRYIRDS